MSDPREHLGRLVHEQRRAFEAERSALKDRPGFILAEWEARHPEQRELDMRIAAAVAAEVRAEIAVMADEENATCTDSEGSVVPFLAFLRAQESSEGKGPNP